jgi:hypothetical protein
MAAIHGTPSEDRLTAALAVPLMESDDAFRSKPETEG